MICVKFAVLYAKLLTYYTSKAELDFFSKCFPASLLSVPVLQRQTLAALMLSKAKYKCKNPNFELEILISVP